MTIRQPYIRYMFTETYHKCSTLNCFAMPSLDFTPWWVVPPAQCVRLRSLRRALQRVELHYWYRYQVYTAHAHAERYRAHPHCGSLVRWSETECRNLLSCRDRQSASIVFRWTNDMFSLSIHHKLIFYRRDVFSDGWVPRYSHRCSL